MKTLLEEFVGEYIATNWPDPAKPAGVRLVAAGDEYFSVSKGDGIVQHFPYRVVMSMTTARDGIKFARKEKPMPIWVTIEHSIIYDDDDKPRLTGGFGFASLNFD